MKLVDAKCKNCGAELSLDKDKTILFCPYCASKLYIIDGDEVKAEKARADAYRDVELAREETKRERARQEHEREKEMIKRGDNVRIELEKLKSERQIEKHSHERRMQKLRNKLERERDTENESKGRQKRCIKIVVSNLFTIISIIVVFIGIHQSKGFGSDGNLTITIGGIMLIISSFLAGRENERLAASMGSMIASIILLGIAKFSLYFRKIGYVFDDIESLMILLGMIALVVSLINVIRKAKKTYLDDR